MSTPLSRPGAKLGAAARACGRCDQEVGMRFLTSALDGSTTNCQLPQSKHWRELIPQPGYATGVHTLTLPLSDRCSLLVLLLHRRFISLPFFAPSLYRRSSSMQTLHLDDNDPRIAYGPDDTWNAVTNNTESWNLDHTYHTSSTPQAKFSLLFRGEQISACSTSLNS